LASAEGALRDLKYFILTKNLRRIEKVSAREKSNPLGNKRISQNHYIYVLYYTLSYRFYAIFNVFDF